MADERTKSRTTSSLFDLTGRVAVVTGASRGIGAGIARALDDAGCRVALVARSEDALHEQAGLLANDPIVIPADISDAAEPTRVIAQVEQMAGRVDVMVNNAGISKLGPAHALDAAGWDEVSNVNLRAMFLFSQAVAPGMIGRGGGKIINTASVISFAADAYSAAYAATKTGVVGLTRALAIEWARKNVQVNALCPGWVATEMVNSLRTESFEERVMNAVPQRRWGEPEDMAGPVVFLASPASDFMTGQTLVVDGGMLAKW